MFRLSKWTILSAFLLLLLRSDQVYSGRKQERFTGSLGYKEKSTDKNHNSHTLRNTGTIDNFNAIKEEGGIKLGTLPEESLNNPHHIFSKPPKDVLQQSKHNSKEFPNAKHKQNQGIKKSGGSSKIQKGKKVVDDNFNEGEVHLTAAEQASLCGNACSFPADRQLRLALEFYWTSNYQQAFDCACAVLKQAIASHHMAHAIMYAVTNAKDSTVNVAIQDTSSVGFDRNNINTAKSYNIAECITNSDGKVAIGDSSSSIKASYVRVYPPQQAASPIVR